MAGTFELKKNAGGEFVFNLKAGNGQVLLTSEGYKAKASATNGIESVRKNATDDDRFDRRTSSNGKPYFVLTATNGQIIGQSQMYSAEYSMENGIRSVRENAPDAEINEIG
jgi:uncharacterized protein YegP (UPF0339 family)